jgi:hypothetical protein
LAQAVKRSWATIARCTHLEVHPGLTTKRFIATIALIVLMVLLNSDEREVAAFVVAVLILRRGAAPAPC